MTELDISRRIEQERNLELLSDPNSVAVLNFGSQHTGEIRDGLQAIGLHAVIVPSNTTVDSLRNCGAVVLSGGSNSVNDADRPNFDPQIFSLGKPLYGICYGAQLIAEHYGGVVTSGLGSEFAQHNIKKIGNPKNHSAGVFASKGKTESVWMNHGDRITAIPDGFRVVAETESGVVAAIASEDRMTVGVQFHPEVSGEGRTVFGKDLFAGFMFDVAKLTPTFEKTTLESELENIRVEVGNREVMLFLSGGVDSAVLLEMMSNAIDPSRIHAVHIDNGFMREGESDAVFERFRDRGVKLYKYNAEEFFLDAKTIIDGKLTKKLREEYDPQRKRLIIGDAFMQYRDVIAQELGLSDDFVLAQGTIRPDLIESGSHDTVTIKSHHNDTPVVRQLRLEGRIIEPLKELYKPGVRALGRTLDMPEDIIMRQPFPGPGLAVRTLNTPPRPLISNDEMMAVRDKLTELVTTERGLTILPVKSVGQRGDDRHYGHTIALSGTEDWDELFSLARSIPQMSSDVTRVVYAFGDRINREIGLRRANTMLDDGSVDRLRKADAVARNIMSRAGLDNILQQVPIVLLPTGIDRLRQQSVVIRTFLTTNFMTGTPASPGSEEMPLDVLHEMVEGMLGVKGISRVLYDMTSKPPGTTEWE